MSAGGFVENELWHIPISIASNSSRNFDPQPELWLDKNIAMTSWEINANEWIILNAGSTGMRQSILLSIPVPDNKN